jgi:hypothetical protein
VSGRNLLGRQPVGAITIVDTPVSQWYVQRARVAFLVVGVVSGVVTAAVSAVFAPMLLAVVLGVLAGVVCGFVAAVLVRSWPVLRVLWWWFFEIAVGAAVVALPSSLARATQPCARAAATATPTTSLITPRTPPCVRCSSSGVERTGKH